ncbi:TRAP transporter substrate-binding protein [Vibrio rhodolitus]|uniref:TRAP transporter substrate-binding protein n=1 Tax=Vibrio rhodolitus TaxID=2231649 RepID=UPI000E0CB13F|nr:TRAP transporter substrate-binding protein [Vibrio rhodolitus]
MKLKKSLLVAALGLSTAFASSISVAADIIRIGHGTNESFHLHRALLEFKNEIEKNSDGRYEVQIFPQSQMGPDREMVEATQSGMLQIAVPPSSILASWDPSFDVIELPFIYPSKQAAFNVVNSEVGDKLLQRLDSMNLKGLGYMESGVRHITNNKRPIKTTDDLNDIKIRTMKVPSHLDTFNSVGASATPMNFGEVYSALQQKVIDGQENPTSIIYSQRFYEVQKYMSLTNHVVTFYLPVMNYEFWMMLSPEDQKLITDAFDHAVAFQNKIVEAEDKQQLAEMIEAGLEVNELTPEAMQVLVDQTQPVREKYRSKIGEDLYDEWSAKAKAAL